MHLSHFKRRTVGIVHFLCDVLTIPFFGHTLSGLSVFSSRHTSHAVFTITALNIKVGSYRVHRILSENKRDCYKMVLEDMRDLLLGANSDSPSSPGQLFKPIQTLPVVGLLLLVDVIITIHTLCSQ